MSNPRAQKLMEKLSRGLSKSLDIFHSIEGKGWDQPIFDEADSWSVKDLVAHFIFAEQYLFAIAKHIASGGDGYPPGIDIDQFNREEIEKYRPYLVDQLLVMLSDVRKTTIEWVEGLGEDELDRIGNHPVLGETSVETAVFSIYAHQLLHMREVAPKLRK